jgi:CRISPR-associated protein Cmr3
VSDSERLTTYWVRLEPEDVLLFRDGRPFNAGQDFRAEGVFPPHPAPIVGAIRAALLSPLLGGDFAQLTTRTDLQQLYGGHDDLGFLEFAGPLVCRFVPGSDDSRPLLPAPADLLGDQVPRPSDELPVGVRSPLRGLTDMPLARTLAKPSQRSSEWLSSEELLCYLQGASHLPDSEVPSYEYPELRVGVQMGPGRVVESGKLYNIEFRRPHWDKHEATGLLMRVTVPEGEAKLSEGYVTLGGEGRCMYLKVLKEGFSPLSNTSIEEIKKTIRADDGRFKIVLATPGIFSGGLIPESFQVGKLEDLSFKLISVASGKPISVSGWNIRENKPRPLQRAVPAGAVYHCQLDDVGQVDRLIELLHFTTRVQKEDEYRFRQGFGLTLIGAWAQKANHD